MSKPFAKFAPLMLIAAGAIAPALTACNDDDEPLDNIDWGYTTENTGSSTAITAFNLKANTKVLASLDSVFFTIDLAQSRIFNADSLPLGTDVSRLLVNIGANGTSKITLKYTDTKGEAKEVEYVSTSTADSINFLSDVKIIVKSLNDLYEQTYDVKVNVHKMKPDSLTWGNVEYSTLPAANGAIPSAQATVERGDKVYCFTQSGATYTMAATPDPALAPDAWQKQQVEFGFTPDLTSMAATPDAFYVLASDGTLHTSADGLTWTATSQTWHHIYGAFGNSVIGCSLGTDGVYRQTSYPQLDGFSESALPAAFPVDGTSVLHLFANEWSEQPQGVMVGGRLSDGTMSPSAWGFDGQQWVRFGNLPKNIALEGVALFPYFTFKTNTKNWKVTTYTSLFAMGGRSADGKVNRNIYISRDLGMNWHLADTLMQLPEAQPALAFATPIVFNSTLGSRAAASSYSGWHPVALHSLPAWLMVEPMQSPISRAVTPITTWECPYIYLYGGYTEGATQLSNTVWRGVVNRLSFKPLQ